MEITERISKCTLDFNYIWNLLLTGSCVEVAVENAAKKIRCGQAAATELESIPFHLSRWQTCI